MLLPTFFYKIIKALDTQRGDRLNILDFAQKKHLQSLKLL